jgi:flagellar motor switch protein FliN/FliY
MKMADETTQVPSATDEKSSAATEGRPLGFVMDDRLQVSVELGRRRYRISELLSLDQGEILELDKVAGEPLDIRVNDHLIARGEAVVVNDKFGVRLTEIIMPADRMGNLDLMEKS